MPSKTLKSMILSAALASGLLMIRTVPTMAEAQRHEQNLRADYSRNSARERGRDYNGGSYNWYGDNDTSREDRYSRNDERAQDHRYVRGNDSNWNYTSRRDSDCDD